MGFVANFMLRPMLLRDMPYGVISLICHDIYIYIYISVPWLMFEDVNQTLSNRDKKGGCPHNIRAASSMWEMINTCGFY